MPGSRPQVDKNRATKFAANDSWGTFYRNLFGQEKMNQSLSVLTGATAGATESFVVVPFELVKIRLQDKAQSHKYNGMVDCVTKIVKQEGPLTLYQGLESTLWRHIPGSHEAFCVSEPRLKCREMTLGCPDRSRGHVKA